MRTEQQASFVEYVRSRGPWMLRVALRLCRDRHNAEDLVQTSQTKLYAHWNRLRSVENLDAYVRTIILRTHIGDRRTGWAKRVDLHPAHEDLPWDEADHAARLVLREAVEGLAPRQRATIVMRYYLDMSVEQTAAALDVTAGTVKSQTSRGLDALRGVLEHGGVRAA
ncbi:SigE family RNA polymerase sigma factor [Umezawaea endophytica]|uniref:SigE family RNA polymerase sigma factor n=1 Tax=Umezawaea endophytica TaxID=1654476 RepID=A0A9X2VJF9_9PSEU|nr:SigE family RNA polymerase sigma factor [Umezawaea endophytica]MCS7477232.1 SigE family RNA polymerase sigma factor [Umezawaea endophytica]